MWWPLGKKFEIWLDVPPAQILESIDNPEILGHYGSHLVPDAAALSNIIMLPRLGWHYSRELWATVQAEGNGTRLSGRYGFGLSAINVLFCGAMIAAFVAIIPTIADPMNAKPAWSFIAGTIIFAFVIDRVTRPLAKMRFNELVAYLRYLSPDEQVHIITP